ncbi:MAG: L,D-transpeptidase family protein [Bacteroidetes bacterium]|nr:L,D-transpeptidase family protein [Bacteroidota bacterium]
MINTRLIKTVFVSGFTLFLLTCLQAQTSVSNIHFIDNQRSIPKIGDVMKRKEDTLMKQFEEKKLVWPANYIYIRSFKYDSELEVWVKNKKEDKYKLFKTYKVCALAGTLGPKRMAGDYQVPEGVYYINEFNSRSQYHLSLGLNYPNASDKLLSDISQPGGDIYIHGSCVTTGCIPLTDEKIEEVYILAAHAKANGQDFIPVHIFPINFKNSKSVAYLNRYLQSFSEYGPFVKNMRNIFYYFEKYREVPLVLINGKGDYVTQDITPPDESKVVKTAVKKTVHKPQPIKDEDLATSVDNLPVYPGGNTAFQGFLDNLSNEMSKDLENGQRKTYVLVEYIIDANGKPVFARVLRGGNDDMNEKIESAFEHMPAWSPAKHHGKNIGIKLKQSFMVGEE